MRDEIAIFVKLKNKKIAEIRFDGYGCKISQAASSLITEFVKGKTLDEVLRLSKKDVLELLGIDVAPLRIKCAMLGLRVLQRGILQYTGMKKTDISLSEIG